MTLWLLSPRDPLIFRDGKPFTAAPGSRAKTLAFPYPSTLVGAVRTQAGTDAVTGHFDKNRVQEVLQIGMRGPLLVGLSEQGQIADWFFPAPADALLFKASDKCQAMRYPLAPIQMPAAAQTDLKDWNLVGLSKIVKEKPYNKPPRFWYQEQFEDWLVAPKEDVIELDKLGIHGPSQESRTHVSIAANTQTALSGALFQTSGLEFMHMKHKEGEPFSLGKISKLGIVFETEAGLKSGLSFLGGERRVAHWEKINSSMPACPSQVKQKILTQGYCRLFLLTPAFFATGFEPEWIKAHYDVKIKAAIVNRYQTISGWDYAYQNGSQHGRPKPTRRLVPAGSVYFLKLADDVEKRKSFLNDIWMNNISDDEQSRRDGLGLAALGTWDDQLHDMEMQS